MRRISVRDVYLWFSIVLAVAFIGGFGIRAYQTSSREEDIERLTKDVAALRCAEGLPSDGQQVAACSCIEKIKALMAVPEYAKLTFGGLLKQAQKLKQSDEELLKYYAASNKWAPIRALADHNGYDRVVELDKNYHLGEIILTGKKVWQTIVIPSPISNWSWGWWKWWYLAGSLVFTLLFSLVALSGMDKHPVLQYPWHRVDAVCMFLVAAPGTVPGLAIYGIYRGFTAEWSTLLQGWWPRLRTSAYRLRLLRRLPTPILAPARFDGAPDVALTPVDAADFEQAVRNRHDAEEEEGAEDENEDDEDPEPQWYVIERRMFLGLTHLLADKGIDLCPITLHEPRELQAFAVAAGQHDDFEKAVGLERIECEEEDTDIDRVVLLNYKHLPGNIEIAGVAKEQEERFTRILEAVSIKAAGASISLRGFRGEYSPPAPISDEVAVFAAATPLLDARRVQIDRCFGRALTTPLIALVPSADGVIIRDPDGMALAQIVGNSVYVLITGLLSRNEDWVDEAYARILHEAVQLSQKEVEREEAHSEVWRMAIDGHRGKYVEMCARRLVAKKEAIERHIAECENLIVEAGKKTADALKKKRESESELTQFVQNDWAVEEERLRKEFDALASSKCVLSVQAGKESIDVYTRTVYIDHMGRRYKIGRFRIRLYTGGHIALSNLASTAKNTGYQHPHVRDPDNPCFGNIQQSLGKLMAERQYAVAVTMLFRYLESYNPHGGVANISNWKEVPREESR